MKSPRIEQASLRTGWWHILEGPLYAFTATFHVYALVDPLLKLPDYLGPSTSYQMVSFINVKSDRLFHTPDN